MNTSLIANEFAYVLGQLMGGRTFHYDESFGRGAARVGDTARSPVGEATLAHVAAVIVPVTRRLQDLSLKPGEELPLELDRYGRCLFGQIPAGEIVTADLPLTQNYSFAARLTDNDRGIALRVIRVTEGAVGDVLLVEMLYGVVAHQAQAAA